MNLVEEEVVTDQIRVRAPAMGIAGRLASEQEALVEHRKATIISTTNSQETTDTKDQILQHKTTNVKEPYSATHQQHATIQLTC